MKLAPAAISAGRVTATRMNAASGDPLVAGAAVSVMIRGGAVVVCTWACGVGVGSTASGCGGGVGRGLGCGVGGGVGRCTATGAGWCTGRGAGCGVGVGGGVGGVGVGGVGLGGGLQCGNGGKDGKLGNEVGGGPPTGGFGGAGTGGGGGTVQGQWWWWDGAMRKDCPAAPRTTGRSGKPTHEDEYLSNI